MGSLLARLKELETNLQELNRFKTLTLDRLSDLRDFAAAIADAGLNTT